VYLGNRWYTLDARHHQPRIGRILIAVGRDATDVAMTTSFGQEKLEKFEVWTDEIPSDAPQVQVTSFVPSAPAPPAPAERI
jgi:transglutaminase-like putative cysteine protease